MAAALFAAVSADRVRARWNLGISSVIVMVIVTGSASLLTLEDLLLVFDDISAAAKGPIILLSSAPTNTAMDLVSAVVVTEVAEAVSK
jgi:hypothetical protein